MEGCLWEKAVLDEVVEGSGQGTYGKQQGPGCTGTVVVLEQYP
jgi:hypothetical protein